MQGVYYNRKVIYSLSGRLALKGESFAIVETAGLGLKVYAHRRFLSGLPPVGSDVKIFCYLYLRENGPELYGFETEGELRLFELLNSVSGVGPKSALSILDISELKNLEAAIKEDRPDLLTRASGVGRKTAERIILELKNKVRVEKSAAAVKKMESDADLAEALSDLGYRREEARAALSKVGEKAASLEDRLKEALKILSGKGS